MASIESVVRFKNAPLLTQQRRMRHLRSVAARNLAWRKKPLADVTQMQTFFTLHRDTKGKALYTSEKITGSLNPSWRSFVLEILGDDGADLVATSFVVRIWQGQESAEHFKVCIEWAVDLTGLVYLGDRLQADGIQHQSNTLIFGMFDGFYGAPVEHIGIQDISSSGDKSRTVLTVDQAWVRQSYSAHTLARIQTILRAIKQTSASVKRVRRNIEEKLSFSERLQTKKSEREMRIVKVNMMRGDLEWRTMQLQSAKEVYETLQATNCQKDVALKTKFETLHKDKGRLHEKKKSYFDVREELIKTGAQLVMRRKQLISELISIYPIRELPDGGFTISSVKLPNSEDFTGHDDTMVAVALGHTCHLVEMISQFLDIPLRYPLEHRGSRSQVTDHIIDKLKEKERDFPLYSKGKEKFQFNYGVYLLNKNIAQVRYYCGLGTTDLRLTLPNLKSLLELRLGVRFEPGNSLLPGQHLIPPNLGGPQKMTSPSFGHPTKAAEAPEEPAEDSDTRQFEEILQESKLLVNGTTAVEIVPSQEVNNSSPSIVAEVAQEVFEASPVETFEVKIPDTCLEGKSGDNDDDVRHIVKTIPTDDPATVKLKQSTKLPPVRALEGLTKQRLLGSLANYDDADVSSSEDSASATYGSKFKLWPRDDRRFIEEEEEEKLANPLPDNYHSLNNSYSTAPLQSREILSSSSDYNTLDDGGVLWDNESSLEQDPCVTCITSEDPSSDIQTRTDALWNNRPASFKLPTEEQGPCELGDPPDSVSHIAVSEASS